MLAHVVLLAVLAPSPAAIQTGCEAAPPTVRVLDALRAPADATQSTAEHKTEQLAALRRALVAAPRDVHLHEAYQRLRLQGPDADRAGLVSEYEALLVKNPRDPLFLYLAARAEVGFKTKDAIAKLRDSVELAPSFPFSHLLLAEIFSSTAYAQPSDAAAHLDAFADACPNSVRAFNGLRWSKDVELIKRTAARIRRAVANRTDTEAVEAYPVLWALEEATERSDHQEENRSRLKRDIDRLFTPAFARTVAWMETLAAVWFVDDSLDQSDRARVELANRYPSSRVAVQVKVAAAAGTLARDTSPEAAAATFRRRWKAALAQVPSFPRNQWLASAAARAVIWDATATADELAAAVAPFVRVLAQQPDESTESPPLPALVATRLVARGAAFGEAIALGLAGLTAADAATSPNRVDDLIGRTSKQLGDTRAAWYLYTYYPLGEAYARLGRLAEARDVLLKYEELLEHRRPPATAPSADRMRFGEDEARFWQLRGILAESENHLADALVAYRNAIAAYPPRRPNGDRRDEAMSAAQKIWKQLGGTSQGWSDWAKTAPLVNFNAGAGGTGSAWGRLAAASPNLVLADTLGNAWQPKDLAAKTVFVTMWASWCGPCRAELPYVEKLYQRFRGRDDIVILALNVDDDPKQMDVALGELKVNVPSVAAREFAYTLVPAMALPSNWILTPSKTEMLQQDAPSLEAWLESTAKAIEAAAGK
jgi:thiol-disulfide isomerase/thioredoxin